MIIPIFTASSSLNSPIEIFCSLIKFSTLVSDLLINVGAKREKILAAIVIIIP